MKKVITGMNSQGFYYLKQKARLNDFQKLHQTRQTKFINKIRKNSQKHIYIVNQA